MLRPALLALLVAANAFAQTPTAGGGRRDESRPNTAVIYERYADEVRAKQAMERARTTLKTRKYREALASDSPSISVTADRFTTAGGVSFVALQAGLPNGIAKPRTSLTFFGELLSSDGTVVSDFELPSTVLDSKGDLYLEQSLLAGDGAASARVGVARNGEILGVAHCSFAPRDRGASQLILSNNIYNMDRAQNPFEPFAFGGTKVVPKPDRTFSRADEAWVFVEWLDADAAAPPLSIRVAVEGESRRMPGLWQRAELTPLKGVSGHYGIGMAIDLSALAPGSYRVKLLVRDDTTRQTVEREQTLVMRE